MSIHFLFLDLKTTTCCSFFPHSTANEQAAASGSEAFTFIAWGWWTTDEPLDLVSHFCTKHTKPPKKKTSWEVLATPPCFSLNEKSQAFGGAEAFALAFAFALASRDRKWNGSIWIPWIQKNACCAKMMKKMMKISRQSWGLKMSEVLAPSPYVVGSMFLWLA